MNRISVPSSVVWVRATPNALPLGALRDEQGDQRAATGLEVGADAVEGVPRRVVIRQEVEGRRRPGRSSGTDAGAPSPSIVEWCSTTSMPSAWARARSRASMSAEESRPSTSSPATAARERIAVAAPQLQGGLAARRDEGGVGLWIGGAVGSQRRVDLGDEARVEVRRLDGIHLPSMAGCGHGSRRDLRRVPSPPARARADAEPGGAGRPAAGHPALAGRRRLPPPHRRVLRRAGRQHAARAVRGAARPGPPTSSPSGRTGPSSRCASSGPRRRRRWTRWSPRPARPWASWRSTPGPTNRTCAPPRAVGALHDDDLLDGLIALTTGAAGAFYLSQGGPTLRLVLDGEEHVVGEGAPGATLTTTPYELMRIVFGRRSEAQIAAAGWSGDQAEAAQAAIHIFDPPPIDITD